MRDEPRKVSLFTTHRVAVSVYKLGIQHVRIHGRNKSNIEYI